MLRLQSPPAAAAAGAQPLARASRPAAAATRLALSLASACSLRPALPAGAAALELGMTAAEYPPGPRSGGVITRQLVVPPRKKPLLKPVLRRPKSALPGDCRLGFDSAYASRCASLGSVTFGGGSGSVWGSSCGSGGSEASVTGAAELAALRAARTASRAALDMYDLSDPDEGTSIGCISPLVDTLFGCTKSRSTAAERERDDRQAFWKDVGTSALDYATWRNFRCTVDDGIAALQELWQDCETWRADGPKPTGIFAYAKSLLQTVAAKLSELGAAAEDGENIVLTVKGTLAQLDAAFRDTPAPDFKAIRNKITAAWILLLRIRQVREVLYLNAAPDE